MNVVERVTGGFSAGGGLSGNGWVAPVVHLQPDVNLRKFKFTALDRREFFFSFLLLI